MHCIVLIVTVCIEDTKMRSNSNPQEQTNEEQKTKSKKRSKIKRSKKMRSDPNLAALYNSERQGSNQFGMKINEN